MNQTEKIYHAIGWIDAKLIEEADLATAARAAKSRKHATTLRYALAAACLCLIAGITVFLLHRSPARPHDPANTAPKPTHTSATSGSYRNVKELLAHLSKHDNHSNPTDPNRSQVDGTISGDCAAAQEADSALTKAAAVVVDAAGRYSYHISEKGVAISRLDGENTKNIGYLEGAHSLFLRENRLILVSTYNTADSVETEPTTLALFYDVSTPETPVLLDQYEQHGLLTDCWMAGDDLYLATSDGICACGYSKHSDPSDYYPSLKKNGTDIPWGEDYVSILGKPTNIKYSAISVINGDTRELVGLSACYGDIEKLSYGADWLAFTVSAATETAEENPVIYTFNGDLEFTGKIDTAKILNLPKTVAVKDYEIQNGTLLSVSSLTKKNGSFRILGSQTVFDHGSQSRSYLAISADPKTEKACANTLLAEDALAIPYDTILWEEDRVLACGAIKNPDASHPAVCFLFAEFREKDILFVRSGLTADRLNFGVGYSLGIPLGTIDSLIPMGNGRYVRYAALSDERGPVGFEVYDFSDSNKPQLLHQSGNPFRRDGAFDYTWHIYDECTFGTVRQIFGAETDDLRNTKMTWCVFCIREDASVELLSEYDLGLSGASGKESRGFTVFSHDGAAYYVTLAMPQPRPLP